MKALDRTHVTRNGLPPRTDYAYRGTGSDTMPWAKLTGQEERALAEQDAEREREAVDTQVRAVRLRANHAAYEPPPVPPVLNGLLNGAPVTAPPAVIMAAPVAVRAEPDPEPPGRCEVCGYLLTAPGHLAECGAR